MIEVTVVRNDLPKLIKANYAIQKKMNTLMQKVGEMRLRSAKEAFKVQGPGWKKHSKHTIIRHGPGGKDYGLLKLSKGASALSNIKNNFTISFPITTPNGVMVRIVPNTNHSKLMTDIHNKPRGQFTIGNEGAKIPGRPFFVWRKTKEGKKAKVLMKQYLGQTFRKYGITMRGLGLEF